MWWKRPRRSLLSSITVPTYSLGTIVVALQLLERVTQSRIVVRVGRVEAREHGRLDVFVPRERLGRRVCLGRDRVSDAEAADVLQARHDVADLTGFQSLGGLPE